MDFLHYKNASFHKLRFKTVRGEITVEQLWELPLLCPKHSGFDLESVAQTIHKEITDQPTISFVQEKTAEKTKADTLQEMRMAIVRDIISDKQHLRQEAERKAAAGVQLKRLLEIRAQRDSDSLQQMSAEDIDARIAELNKQLA